MKRTPLARQTKLARRTPLASGGLGRHRSLLTRTGKARRVRAAARPVVAAVFERDGGCVMAGLPLDVAGICLGPDTPHHLLKASQGGKWTADNVVTLCANHNVWVEDQPDIAWGLGLVVRRGDTVRQAWAAMRNAGLTPGRQPVPCPSSGMAPESTPVDGRAICQGCGHPVDLTPCPSGWGGAVLADHDREVL